MENILISVIVPVFNAESYVKQCLESLLNQSYKNIEIIAIDDASTDGTPLILDSYERKYKNLKVVHQIKNGRQGAARNVGLKIAKGEYISFVDSDDWVDNEMYMKVKEKLKKGPDLLLIMKYYRNYQNGNEIVIDNFQSNDIINNHIEKLIYKGSGVCMSLFKKEMLLNNNVFFPEGLSYEDNYFVPLAVAYAEKLEYINEPFYHYRENPNSTSYREDLTQLNRFKIECLRYEAFVNRGLLNKYHDGYEMLAITVDYLVSLGIFCKYFPKDFSKYALQMKKIIYKEFPNFKKNIYYHELSVLDKVKIKLMEISPKAFYAFYKVNKVLKNRQHL